MGTLADKLAYTARAKEEIRDAIISKGVDCPGAAPFCNFDDYIAQISGGGAQSAINLSFKRAAIIGATEAFYHSDTELSPTLSLSDIAITDSNNRIKSFTLVDSLNFTLDFDELQPGDLIEVQLLPSCFVNKNGSSNVLSRLISEVVDIKDLLDVATGMTYVLDSSSYVDSGSYSIPMSSSWWQTLTTDATVSTDGVITLGSYAIHINARDSSAYQICYATYTLSDNTTVQKIRWDGLAYYSYTSTRYTWELYLFSTGTAFIHLVNQPSDYFTGTFLFMGMPYTVSAQSKYVSFYPTSYTTDEYRIVNDFVDESITLKEKPAVYTLDDLISSKYYMSCILSNIKKDDAVVSTSSIAWAYSGSTYNTLYISGNSFIGVGSSSEHILLNRRDAAVYSIYVQSGKVSIGDTVLDFTKVRWKGYSTYDATSSGYLLEWDLYLFSNGDAMIQLINKPESGWDGAFTFFGTPYNVSDIGDICSFYRQDAYGTSWTVTSDLYDSSLSLSLMN